MPAAARAAIRCSMVPTLAPFASIVVLRVVSTNSAVPNWVRVGTKGAPSQGTSNLNVSNPNSIEGNLVFVKLDANGQAEAEVMRATDLVVDIQGYFENEEDYVQWVSRAVDSRLGNPSNPEPIPEQGVLTQLSASGRNPVNLDEIGQVSCQTTNKNFLGEPMKDTFARRLYLPLSGLPAAGTNEGRLATAEVEFMDELGRVQTGVGYPDASGRTLVTVLGNVYSGNMSYADLLRVASRSIGKITIKVVEPDYTLPVEQRTYVSTFAINLAQCELDLIQSSSAQ